MYDYYDEPTVDVVDPQVDMVLPDEFADDPHITPVTVRKQVEVIYPGYECECGAQWWPDGEDTIEDSRRHYENHKREWCKLREDNDS